VLRDYFLPHRDNAYKPGLLTGYGVTALILVAFLLFVGSQVGSRLVLLSEEFLASVLPAVLVDLTNGNRAELGIGQLSVNPLLTVAAQEKANDMARNSYFAHTSPGGVAPWHWFEVAGYKFSYAGENLAVNFTDSSAIDVAWMNSPLHRANIVNGNFTEIGIATAEGVYNGQATIFVVQMFGRPAPISAPLAATAAASGNGENIEENIETTPPGSSTVSGASTTPIVTEVPVPPQATTSTSVAPSSEHEILEQTPTFIAVKASPLELESSVAQAGTTSVQKQSTFLARLLTQPNKTLRYVYYVLAGLVALIILLTIAIEIRVQYPKNILYGVLALCVIGGLVWLSYYLSVAGLAIV